MASSHIAAFPSFGCCHHPFYHVVVLPWFKNAGLPRCHGMASSTCVQLCRENYLANRIPERKGKARSSRVTQRRDFPHVAMHASDCHSIALLQPVENTTLGCDVPDPRPHGRDHHTSPLSLRPRLRARCHSSTDRPTKGASSRLVSTPRKRLDPMAAFS